MKTNKPATNGSHYETKHEVGKTLWVAFTELHDDLCGVQDLDHEALVAAFARVFHVVVNIPPGSIDQFMRAPGAAVKAIGTTAKKKDVMTHCTANDTIHFAVQNAPHGRSPYWIARS